MLVFVWMLLSDVRGHLAVSSHSFDLEQNLMSAPHRNSRGSPPYLLFPRRCFIMDRQTQVTDTVMYSHMLKLCCIL